MKNISLARLPFKDSDIIRQTNSNKQKFNNLKVQFYLFPKKNVVFVFVPQEKCNFFFRVPHVLLFFFSFH